MESQSREDFDHLRTEDEDIVNTWTPLHVSQQRFFGLFDSFRCLERKGKLNTRRCGAFPSCLSGNVAPDDSTQDTDDSNLSDGGWMEFHKACWGMGCYLGLRNLTPILFTSTISHFDVDTYPGVRGHVALTIDDAPCRQPSIDRSMVQDVRTLLKEFESYATFFLCTDFVLGHEGDLQELLKDRHEVANHCPADRPYADDSEADFENSLIQAEDICRDLRSSAGLGDADVRWFRAPHARITSSMQRVLDKHGFLHVLGDSYANDPWIGEAAFISETLLQHAKDGSILVIHMPERGFREYNFLALRQTLQGLKDRNFKVVTLSELYGLAHSTATSSDEACTTPPDLHQF